MGGECRAEVITLKYLERCFVRGDKEIRVQYHPRTQRVVTIKKNTDRNDLVRCNRQINALTLELMSEGYTLGPQSIKETV